MRLTDLRDRMRGRPAVEVAQRASQFVDNAFPTDRRNTRYVAIARVQPTRRGWRFTTVTKIRGQRARYHVQLVHPIAGYRGSIRRCSHLQIDCDCGRHTFVWNHPLFEAGLAVVDRTNGDAPDITNPANRLGACKHCIVDLLWLIRENPSFPHHAPADPTEAAHGDGTVRLRTMRGAR